MRFNPNFVVVVATETIDETAKRHLETVRTGTKLEIIYLEGEILDIQKGLEEFFINLQLEHINKLTTMILY